MSRQSQYLLYLLVSLSLEGLKIAGNHGDIQQSEAQHKRSRADTVLKHYHGRWWKCIYRVRIKYCYKFHRAHWIIRAERLIKRVSTVSPLSEKMNVFAGFSSLWWSSAQLLLAHRRDSMLQVVLSCDHKHRTLLHHQLPAFWHALSTGYVSFLYYYYSSKEYKIFELISKFRW